MSVRARCAGASEEADGRAVSCAQVWSYYRAYPRDVPAIKALVSTCEPCVRACKALRRTSGRGRVYRRYCPPDLVRANWCVLWG
jgi:hypothetical protein